VHQKLFGTLDVLGVLGRLADVSGGRKVEGNKEETGDEPRVYGTQEAAGEIGIAASTLRQILRKKRASGKKRGEGRTNAWLLTQDEVDRLKEVYRHPVTV
jgi:hypothetical protein